jgi:hypothetical protein
MVISKFFVKIQLFAYLSVFLLGVFAFSFKVSAAGADCTAYIDFNVSPQSISLTKSASVSGFISADVVEQTGYFAGQCTFPNTLGYVSEYIVSIFDLNSNQEILYINGVFKLPINKQNPPKNYYWDLPARQIGFVELNNAKLNKPTSLNLVARVKVTNNGQWYQLTQSAPVAIQVDFSGQGGPTPPNATTLKSGESWGCLGNDWKYYCSSGGKSDCSDIPNKQGVCASSCTPVTTTQCDQSVVSSTPTDPNVKTSPATGKYDCTAAGAKQKADYAQNCLINPLPTDDLLDMLLRIVRGFLMVIGGWAVAFIIIGGFKMVASQGNDEAYGAAKKTIAYAVIGLVVALLSFSIIAIVQSILGSNIPAVIK